VPSPFRSLRSIVRRNAENSPPLEASGETLTVTVTGRPPAHRVAYVDQLGGDNSAGGAPSGVVYEFRDRLSGPLDSDVIYLTDPRAVVGDSRTPEHERAHRARKFVKTLKRRRIALVRSLYGESTDRPTLPPSVEDILDAATSSYVAPNTATPVRHGREATVVPHSHLRERFLGYPRSSRVAGRLLFTSSSTFPAAYEGPLKVFPIARLDDWNLRLVGKPADAVSTSFTRTITRNPATISIRNEPLSDAALIDEIAMSELTVVAAPDSHETLSTIMLALSLDRPVLAESTAATRLLSNEVGPDWVRLHDGPLTAASLEAAIKELRRRPAEGSPNLTARDPNAVATEYARVFRSAVAVR
jgi:beta-1,4-mannosyltransferase